MKLHELIKVFTPYEPISIEHNGRVSSLITASYFSRTEQYNDLKEKEVKSIQTHKTGKNFTYILISLKGEIKNDWNKI